MRRPAFLDLPWTFDCDMKCVLHAGLIRSTTNNFKAAQHLIQGRHPVVQH